MTASAAADEALRRQRGRRLARPRRGRGRRGRRPCARCGSRARPTSASTSATSAAVTKLSRAICSKRSGRSSSPSSTDAVSRAIATASSSARGTVPFSRWKWSVRAEPVCSVGERGGKVAGGLAGLRADRRERVRVLLLRHQRAGAAVGVGELDEAELLARVDLEVLAELALVRRRDRERREQLDVDVGLPGGVLRVLDQRRRSPGARRAGPRSSAQREPALPPAPGDARAEGGVRRGARARRRAAPDRRRPAAGARPSSAAPAADRCSRWRARRVVSSRVPGERRGLADERVVQLANARSCAVTRSATRNASRRGRPALSQPAAERPTRRSSSASRALKASPSVGSHGNSSPGIACSSSRPRRSACASSPREVAALDERDGVREIGERQAAREPRAVRALGGVRGGDELAGRAAAEPPAAPQLVGVGHPAEPREMGGNGA